MILIISADEDINAQAVMRELAQRGHYAVRMLNLSEFPMRIEPRVVGEQYHARRSCRA